MTSSFSLSSILSSFFLSDSAILLAGIPVMTDITSAMSSSVTSGSFPFLTGYQKNGKKADII